MARYNVGDAVLKIAPSLEGFQAKLEAELEAIKKSLDIVLKPDLERFVTELDTSLKAISEASSVTVKVKADTSEASAHIDAWRDAQQQNSVQQKVDADTLQASVTMASWRARQEAAVVKQKVIIDEIDPPGGGGGGGGGGGDGDAEHTMRVVQNFHGTTLFDLANISAAAAAVGGVVAALGGVVAAAAAAGTALGAMGAVIGVGGSGIIGAFTAMKKESTAAATGGADAAKQQREELDRVADATDSVRRAQDDYADALGKVEDANSDLKRKQDELTDSWTKGTRELRDLNDEVVGAGQSQERAAISVARAKERALQVKADFRKGDASLLDVQDAELGVREAQQGFKEAQNNFADKKVDTRNANARGVAGTDAVTSAQQGVVDAQKAVKDANDQVTDSAVRLARANRELLQAQADVGASSGPASTAADKFAAAMAKLSPNAQDFVNKIRSMGDAWHTLRMSVQDTLFDGLGDTMVRFGKDQFPEMQRGMVQLAGVANGLLKSSIDRVSATFTEFSKDGTFNRFLGAVSASFSGFVPVLDSVVRALTGLTIGIGPSLGTMFQSMAKYINDTTPFWTNLGKVATDALTQIFPILTQLFTSFEPGAVLIPTIVTLFQEFANVVSSHQGELKQLAELIGVALTHAMQSAGPAMTLLIPALETLLRIFNSMPPEMIGAIFAAMIVSRSVLNPMLSLANNLGRLQALWGNLGAAARGAQSLWSRMGSAMSSGANGAATVWSAAGARIRSAWDSARLAGMYAMDGIKRGAQSAANAARTAFASSAAAVSSGMSRAATAANAGMAAAGRGASAAWTWLTALPGRIAASTAAQKLSAAATAAWTGAARLASVSWAFLTGLPARIAATTVAQKLAAGATTAWSIAQGVLNAVMTANPIGLLIVALVAVVAAIVVAYQRSETFREIVQKCWEGIKNAAEAAWNGVLKPLFETFVDNLKNIGKVFEGMGQIIKAGWDFIVNVGKAAVGLLTGDFDLFNNGMKGIGEVAKKIAEGIKTAFSGIVGVIKAPVHAIGKLLEKIPNKVLGISIPGASTLRSWGTTLTNLREGGAVAAGRRTDGSLYGPGTETSDDILGYDESGPTAWVSRDEGVVNARGLRKHRGLFDAINADDPALANLPRRSNGGPVYGPFLPGREPNNPYAAMYPQQAEDPGVNPDAVGSGGLQVGMWQGEAPTQYEQWYGEGSQQAPPEEFVAPAADGSAVPVEDPAQLQAPAGQAGSTPSGFSGSGAMYGGDAAARASQYANSHAGEPYVYGALDCSGFMSGIYASFMGLDTATRHFSTESDFLQLGFVEGLTDGFQIGIHRGGGGPNSHMGGTLPDGTRVESDGSNGIQVGGGADGADSSQFELKYTLTPDRWAPPGQPLDVGTELGYGLGGGSGSDGSALDGMSFEDYLANGGDTSQVLSDGQVSVTDEGSGDSGDEDADALNVPKMFGKAGEILGNGLLSFFGLENSILSGDNVYNKAIQDTYDFYNPKDKDKKKGKKGKKSQYESNTGNVGRGNPNDPKSGDLLNGADTSDGFLYDTEAPTFDAPIGGAYDPRSGADQWHDNIVAALIREGYEPSERNIQLTKAQIMTESGGRPDAVQQVQDVNSGGNEAVGLLQIAKGTWPGVRNPALPDDRTNPDASISAGLRYMKQKYNGNLEAMWGQGHGYDIGGWLEPTPGGFGTYFNHTGDPEAVLTSGQWGNVENLISTTEKVFSGLSSNETARMAGAVSPSSSASFQGAIPTSNALGSRSVTHDNSTTIGSVTTADPNEFFRQLERKAAQKAQAFLPTY